jgi:hypothetical protein
MPKLTIVRGLPGSGKSTYAEGLTSRDSPRILHYEADMFFYRWPCGYEFNPLLLGAAHDWCYSSTVRSLWQRHDVIVSNSFVRLWELERYVTIPSIVPSVDIEIIEVLTQYNSVHGVPEEKIQQMRESWCQVPEEWKIPVKQIR